MLIEKALPVLEATITRLTCITDRMFTRLKINPKVTFQSDALYARESIKENVCKTNHLDQYVTACMNQAVDKQGMRHGCTQSRLGMASNNMRPLQFLGSLYLNDTHKIHTLGPPHIAQHHA